MHRSRPNPSSHSVILCGLRDVRDYEVDSGADLSRLGTSSPFNAGDFDEDEVRSILRQHTEDTGQAFEPEALARVDAARSRQQAIATE